MSLRRPLRRRAIAAGMVGLMVGASCASPRTAVERQGLTGATTTFLHTGFQVGPAVFTDGGGHLVEERRYEPFGAPIDAHIHTAAGDAVGAPDLVARDLNPLNKRSDPSTGWSDHDARWLAPETARWLTPDPPVGGPDPAFMAAPWALHPYQYVHQNPVAYWDPDGRQADAALLSPGAGAVISGGAAVASKLAEYGEPGVIAGGIVMAGTLFLAALAYRAEHHIPNGVCFSPVECMDDGGIPYEFTEQYEQNVAKAAVKAASDRMAQIRELAQARAAAAAAAAKESKPEKTVLLHRGVTLGHPGYELAALGTAVPRGGNATPAEHNAGDTDSVYTSWTRRWDVAEAAAMDSYYGTGGRGVVLTARIPVSRLVESPDIHDEDEVLVTGTVSGARVRFVPDGKSHDDD